MPCLIRRSIVCQIFFPKDTGLDYNADVLPALKSRIERAPMTNPLPTTGIFAGQLHHFPVRIYYEDTDLSGLVYHANYLRYMERARSDWIGQLGMDQRGNLEAPEPLFFVVAELTIRYIRPAKLGDALVVTSTLTGLGGASMTVSQGIACNTTQLTDAAVRIGFVGADGRPRRLPKPLHGAMSALLVA
jgi:acyl-CoA thioester hydrolase